MKEFLLNQYMINFYVKFLILHLSVKILDIQIDKLAIEYNYKQIKMPLNIKLRGRIICYLLLLVPIFGWLFPLFIFIGALIPKTESYFKDNTHYVKIEK